MSPRVQEQEQELTTSTRKHLSVRTKLDAVDRSVVSFQDLSFFPIHSVYTHPLIRCIPGYKSILENRVYRSRRRRVKELQRMRLH